MYRLPVERSDSHMTRYEHKRQSNGAMEEPSRKVQNAMTHAAGCILVDVAVVEVDGAAGDVDASSLQADVKRPSVQRGDG